MKSICRKSGITLVVCDDQIAQAICDIHPIFRLDREQLYKLMQKVPAKLPIQRRLYFLALLSLTDLCEAWESPFIPSDEAVELGFPLLIDIHSLLQKRGMELPTVRLSPDCDIVEVLKLWRRGLHGFGLVAKASETDKLLAINEAWHKAANGKLSPKHISFALDYLGKLGYSDAAVSAAAGVLAEQVQEISITRHQYLRELYDALQDILPVSNNWRNVTFYILRHVQSMIDHCETVKADVLGNKIRKEEQIIAGVSSFKIVEVSENEADSIEESKKAALAPEPKAGQFPSYSDFLKARAIWRAARFSILSGGK